MISDPDFNPRGTGCHLGNNNMTINRTLALSYFAGLLPDHPRYAYWMAQVHGFARYKYGSENAVDGPNIECPLYALYSPYRTLNVTQNILRNRGIYDFAADGYQAAIAGWLGNLTMADPRYQNLRIIPGMGNSSNLVRKLLGFQHGRRGGIRCASGGPAALHEPVGEQRVEFRERAELSRSCRCHAARHATTCLMCRSKLIR